MKLRGRIPVEPLDEERLTNLERRIVTRAADLVPAPVRQRRRGWAFAGAAMAVAAAGVIGWKLHAAAPMVASAEPQVLAVHTDAEHSTLDLGDTKITSAPATAFDVTRTDGRIVVTMAHGRIDLAVVHREGRVVVVRAGDTDIEDVGTRFSVDYDGAGHVDVRVTEGEVKVTHQQRTELIAAGKQWTTAIGIAAIAQATPPTPATLPAIGSGSGSAIVIAVKDAPDLLHGRHAAVPVGDGVRVADRPSPKPLQATTGPSSVDTIQRAPKPPTPPADPYVELKTAIKRQPIAFDPGIDGKADATNEIAKLKKVAYSTTMGSEAALALYRIAVLLHRPLMQDPEALRTLDIYRQRFAAGKELEAALWLRVRIVCGHAIDDDCRKAAYSYQQVGSGTAAEIAIRITNAQ